MKKSELRNIIRGVIKEHTMGNVPGTYPHGPVGHPWNPASGSHGPINGRYVSTLDSPSGCNNLGTNGMAYSVGVNNTGTVCMTVNGGQVPQQGQKFMIGGSEKVITAAYDHPFCYGNSAPMPGGGFYNPPGSPGTVGNFADHQTTGNCQTTTTGCDPSAPFPPNFNLQSWTQQWTNLPNFSNTTNPNQPCNFICQRRNQWTSQLATGGMGPKQTNMVACRLAEAENQYQIHNCANSNANNCP